MDVTFPRLTPFVMVATIALLATVGFAPHVREPRYELRGEGNLRLYGNWLAADENAVVTVDREEDKFFLRFDRVSGGKVVAESRVVLGDVVVGSVDVRGDVAAAYVGLLSTNEVRFYGHVNQRWKEVQRITLSDECIDKNWFFTGVRLGADIAVVEARQVWCVFERRGRWMFTKTIPHGFAEGIRVSGNRILIVGLKTIEQIVRDGRSWKRTTLVTLSGDLSMFADFDASERWILARTNERALHVYDLDDHARCALSIQFDQFGEAERIGIGERTLAYTSGYGSHAWCFDRKWHACGSLEGARGTWLPHPVAIGDVIWVGDPQHPDETDEPGRVFGYDL